MNAEIVKRSLHIQSPPDSVDNVHGLLESVWTCLPDFPAIDRFRFETAVIELAANVIRYGNDGSLVECTITIETSSGHIRAVLNHSGAAPTMQLRGRAMPDPLSESGRGLALIEALVDDMSVVRRGGTNRWTLTSTIAA